MSGDPAPAFDVRERPPTVRCYRCGSPQLRTVCRRCHRAMCKDDPPPPRWDAVPRRVLPDAWSRRIPPAPNTGLCAVCEPVVPGVGRTPLTICLAPAVCGAVVLVWSALAGVLLLLVGLGLTGALLMRAIRRQRGQRRIESRRLRLTPAINRISLIDEVRATAELQNGTYSMTRPETTGRLTIEAEWGDTARGTVRTHALSRPAVRPEHLVFEAGILVLRGEAGLELTSSAGRPQLRWIKPGILMLTDRVGHHRRLSGDDPADRAWTISTDYTITEDPEREPALPIWLTPTLVPRADRRSLDLEVQWSEFGPQKEGMPLLAIDRLRVDVPDTWGHLLNTRPGNATLIAEDAADGRRDHSIEWRGITDVPHTARGSHCISMQFQQRIMENDSLKGRIEARFDGTLCRVTGFDLYDLAGKKQTERPRRRRYTRVVLDFHLSLASLRYEDLRILPTEESRGGESYDGVIPNAYTVAAMTSALSASDCYVKRVMENPGRPGKDPSTIYRFWDVAGRKYIGVYPIDFHITITGNESYRGSSVTAARTEFSLTVRGAYSSDEGHKLVNDEWENLWAQIDDALRNHGKRPTPGPDDGRAGGGRP